MERRKKCVKCGRTTTDYFEILDIFLCAEHQKSNPKYRLITKTVAKRTYELNEEGPLPLKRTKNRTSNELRDFKERR